MAAADAGRIVRGAGRLSDRWRCWIDTGGTFTDCLAVAPGGELRRAKVLSSSALRARVAAVSGGREVHLTAAWTGESPAWEIPADFFRGFTLRLLQHDLAGLEVVSSAPGGGMVTLTRPLPDALDRLAGEPLELASPEEAPVLAARLVTGTATGKPLPPLGLRLATTRGTNALLERKGAATALFVTRGFGDLLRIGTQQRPELFARDIVRPRPLYVGVVEVAERLAADGAVLLPLDPAADRDLGAAARRLLAEGCRSAAVALLHSYLNPEHEHRLGDFLRALGFSHVSLSAELAPLIKLLPRAETALVDAYLSPLLESYLAAVGEAVPRPDGSLHVMTSAGGLVAAGAFRARDGLLSGPAGGVVGAARAGRLSGFERVIAFDMGGTSTDVARHDGDFEYLFEHRVGDAQVVAPALAIESVAAGGGSVCTWDRGELSVGPQSAGARPGPACYGAGGPLTLTDVNLLLGRLAPERFEIPLDVAAAERAWAHLRAELAGGETGPPAREEVLAGLLEIANERMAEAIRAISLRRGYDPSDYVLVAFGGAGGQHACAVAGLLGIRRVLVPQDAGLLSALGLGAAVVERFAQRQVLRPLFEVEGLLPELLAELGREAAAAVAAEGIAEDRIVVRRRLLNLRYAGQEATLALELQDRLQAAAPATPGSVALAAGAGAAPPLADLAAGFADVYRDIYGYLPEGREIEVESIRVVASTPPGEVAGGLSEGGPAASGLQPLPSPTAWRRAWVGGDWRDIPLYVRSLLPRAVAFTGPALVVESHTATVVEEGWEALVDDAGGLLLSRRAQTPAASELFHS